MSNMSPGQNILQAAMRCGFTRSLAYTVGILSTIPLVLYLTVGFDSLYGHPVRSFRQTPIQRASFRRDPDEYVLDPAWDVGAAPTTRYYNWTISEVEGNPDGVFRTLILINSQFPGPLLECNDGDTLIIDVHNLSINSTSLHWHGQYQNGTNWMDGTVGVTNCPIPPGASFRYEFTVRGQYGTYWYHAHFSTTRIDGLFGPFIIHSPHEKTPPYDSDRIVMVHDHYHDLSSALLPTYLAPDNENAEPVPNGALINGQNTINCTTVDPRYTCDASSTSLATFPLSRGKTHRLRFINVGAFAEFEIEIDSHELTLIEADGTPLTPYPLHRFRINIAQRYSILLTATHPHPSYYLRARMLTHCFATTPHTLSPTVLGIIHYTPTSHLPSLPTTTPLSSSPQSLECKDLDPTALTPASPNPPPPASTLIRLRSNFEIGAYALSRGFFNGTSWRPAEAPTLHSVLGNATVDPGRDLVVSLRHGETVDVLIDNFDDGNHPFHLHGHKFWVLGQGRGYYNGSVVGEGIMRDTVSVEQYGWVLVRFTADNPGMWALHCHIVWHMEAGMLMQFLEAGEVVRGWTVPEGVKGLCGGVQRGGGIDDEVFMVD